MERDADGRQRQCAPPAAADPHGGFREVLLGPRLIVFAACIATLASAQAPPPPVSGAAGLEITLRRLETTGVVMIANAHPDDENNALIALLSHGLGMRVVEATATRGEGGQNDLGPEQGVALSILRTEELLAVHRLDGAEQLFARAVDFGYSFSVEETFARWGRQEILADYVRMIRAVRPNVIITMAPDGGGGGQHHQASARIAREAFDAAADPSRFPEQMADGLRPWQAARLYVPLGDPPAMLTGAAPRAETRGPANQPESRPGDVTIDADRFDAALGCTYAELGTRARSMHKTQGMARLLAMPGPAVFRYRPAAGVLPHAVGPRDPCAGAGSLFAGVVTTLDALRWSGEPGAAIPEMAEVDVIQASVAEARAALRERGPGAAVAPLVRGLHATRVLHAALASRESWHPKAHDIGLLLAHKEQQFLDAIRIAAGMRFEAVADDGVVEPGQQVKVSVWIANRLAPDLAFDRVTFEGFDPPDGGCATRPSANLPPSGLVTCESVLRIPEHARPTAAPWRRLADAARNELDPDVPFGAPFRRTPFRARAHLSCGPDAFVFEAPVQFRDGSDPIAGEKRSELIVVPSGMGEGPIEVIDYPHVDRRPAPRPAWHLPPLDVRLAAKTPIGWIRGVGDRCDEAIRLLGGEVLTLADDGLRDLDPSRCAVVLVAARALELRPGPRSLGRDLVRYCERGGVAIVLYQRSGFDEGAGAPYPAKPGTERISDERAPVRLLVPQHPVFNEPNQIDVDAWAGWVQERGRSFLETKDPRYTDLIEMEDPFDFNKGPKRGALVEAHVGKGRWIYVGLGLSRQIDEGVPGAYRLLANLLSLAAR